MPHKDPNKQKEYKKAWNKAHKESEKAKMKVWEEEHKDEIKAYQKAYRQAHKEEVKAKKRDWYQANKEYAKLYTKSDLNSLGQTKHSIRNKSYYYLKKYGTIIKGYEIHHCCTYTEPYKFIYCPIEIHKLIHSYLKAHNIDADSNHYKYIEHLLDDSVVKYGID